MEQQLLIEELVTGYRAYAEPADLELSGAVSPPATTWACGAAASFLFSYVTSNGPGKK